MEKAAADLLLEPSDLLEVYQVFFQDCSVMLGECHQGLEEMDLGLIKRILHGLKGVSGSLQMDRLTEQITAMESCAIKGEQERLGEQLAAICDELRCLELEVSQFYNLSLECK